MTIPELGPETSLRLSRQGGFAAVPGLARPRQIEFAGCDAAQRRGICAMLERCLPVASKSVGAGDQRFYQVELHYRREDADAEMILQIPEERAPRELVQLWQDGAIASDAP
ncbi:protealysin inhibitor emfourin [Pseudomonas lopnurensis]|uniref:protealysin inhibitor emfourin n=1 Tax=Pseudomonas lopnurensis TaxID=1477517 RepID=UPI0028A677E9|nr:protealysin inhibitor emfourin [Pseudomonas lopnurensis]